MATISLLYTLKFTPKILHRSRCTTTEPSMKAPQISHRDRCIHNNKSIKNAKILKLFVVAFERKGNGRKKNYAKKEPNPKVQIIPYQSKCAP